MLSEIKLAREPSYNLTAVGKRVFPVSAANLSLREHLTSAPSVTVAHGFPTAS